MGSLQDIKAAINNTDSHMGHSADDIKSSVYDMAAPVRKAVVQTVGHDPVPVQEYPAGSTLAFYTGIAESYCRLSREFIDDNVAAIYQGLPDDERMVSLEACMFIASRAGFITAALILDYKGCRDMFINVLSSELDLLQLPYDARAAHRVKSGNARDIGFSHVIELGSTVYTPEILSGIALEVRRSIDAISGTDLSAAVDAKFAGYTQEDADMVGLIMSNPVYLLVAFNNNAVFLHAVTSMCEDIASDYNIAF